jgi:hypothetical protein
MAMMRRAALVLVLLPLTFSREALASKNFPPFIQQQLRLPAAPECTLCHQTNEGELDTVVRPFGLTARKYGLIPINTGKLSTVIAEMEKNGDDSDGDGDGDIFELRNGTNPNIPHGAEQGPDDAPRYGLYCATVPGGHRSLGAPAAWAAGFFLAAWRASSRRGRRPRR